MFGRLGLVAILMACVALQPCAGEEPSVIPDLETTYAGSRDDIIVNDLVIYRGDGAHGLGILQKDGSSVVIVGAAVLDCVVLDDGRTVKGLAVSEIPNKKGDSDIRQQVAFFKVDTHTGAVQWYKDKALKERVAGIAEGRSYSLSEQWRRLEAAHSQSDRRNVDTHEPAPPPPPSPK